MSEFHILWMQTIIKSSLILEFYINIQKDWVSECKTQKYLHGRSSFLVLCLILKVDILINLSSFLHFLLLGPCISLLYFILNKIFSSYFNLSFRSQNRHVYMKLKQTLCNRDEKINSWLNFLMITFLRAH